MIKNEVFKDFKYITWIIRINILGHEIGNSCNNTCYFIFYRFTSLFEKYVKRKGGEVDEATEGKFVSFCAIADFPELNCSIPTGGEEALTVRGKRRGR